LDAGIQVVPDEIENRFQEGITNPFGRLLCALGDSGQKGEDFVRAD
jgi:hypothetical protein